MSLRTIQSPRSPGGRAASYELYLLFTYIIGYWELYRRFLGGFFLGGLSGGGGGGTWEYLCMEEFFMGKRISKKGELEFPVLF